MAYISFESDHTAHFPGCGCAAHPGEALKHHVTGAIERGEKHAIVEQTQTISEQEETRRGTLLAEVLSLKLHGPERRYDTTWGNKTALGLYRTVARIVLEGK